MKKFVFPLLIVFLLLASVSPVFAKGKGPNGKGHEKRQETQLQQGVTEIGGPEETETPEAEETPEGNPNGKKGLHGNPHGNKSIRQAGNSNLGGNFVLFGVVTANDQAGTITVMVDTGNSVVKDSIGKTVTVTLDDTYTVIRLMDDNPSLRMKIADIPVGGRVRVHGWLTVPADTAPAASDTTLETTVTFGTARQVNVFTSTQPDELPTEETTVPQG